MTIPRETCGHRSRTLVLSGLLAATAVIAGADRAETDYSDPKLRFGPGQWNHPVGMRPSSFVAIPDGWPLDANGAITCKTCHKRIPAFGGASPTFLRAAVAGDSGLHGFCARCHGGGEGFSARTMHWQVAGAAHIRATNDGAKVTVASLDGQSRRCLGCHDGVSATESNGGNHTGGFAGGRGREHPVGVEYGRIRGRRQKAPLRPRELLPDDIRLPDGRVSCVSCHNLYGDDAKLLSVPIQDSKLCFTCHDMG